MVKLIYTTEDGEVLVLGRILTNHAISVEDALRLLQIDMDDFAAAHNWDGYDYEALDLL